MSNSTIRPAASCHEAPVDARLARLLDSSAFARVVPHLAPETLHQIVRTRGLDACGALVVAATPAQLTSLLDLDLWRPAGFTRDEQFDVDRFGEWLEMLADIDASTAARTVASLDVDLVVLGLSRYIRVFDPGIFEPTAQSDDESITLDEAMREGDVLRVLDGPEAAWRRAETAPVEDVRGDDGLACELGGFIVRARRDDAWDAILDLLAALNEAHHDRFQAVMRGCRDLSHSRPEVDGLDDLLLRPEQHLHDVGLERERRQSRLGYATPADARAFLLMARRPGPPPAPSRRAVPTNPIVAAYFRTVDEAASSDDTSAPVQVDTRADEEAARPHHAGVAADVQAVVELLAEAGVTPHPPRALLVASADEQPDHLPDLRRLLSSAQMLDDGASLTRGRELAFLANALLAGGSIQSRAFTPGEASEAAAAVCNLGLACWPRPRRAGPLPDAFLVDHDLVTVFERGWSVLYRQVTLPIIERLVTAIDSVTSVDRDTREDLRRLRSALLKGGEAGTPWLARDAADVLATLDATVWASVLGLLDECPHEPAALTAIVEGHATVVSPTDFAFISTRAQIDRVDTFLDRLPSLLSS